MSLKQYRYLALAIALTIMLVRVFTISMYNDKGGRTSIRGDAFSDINTHSAVHFFYEHGFSESSFLPAHCYSKGEGLDGEYYFYTHYPAFPDIMAGMYSYIVGPNESLLRLFSVLFSVLLFFIVYKTLKNITQDELYASVGTILLVLSNCYIAWGDNLHKHMWEQFFIWSFIYYAQMYYSSGRKKVAYPIIMSLICVLAVNTSYELVPIFAVFTLGYSFLFEKKIFNWENFLFGFAIVFGFALHLYQNYDAFGSWDAVIADMSSAAIERTKGDVHSDLGRELEVLEFFNFSYNWIIRIERYFLLSGPIVAALFILLIRNKKIDRQIIWLSAIGILAAMSWGMVMPQHAFVHIFTAKHYGFVVTLIGGVGLVEYYRLLKAKYKKMHIAWKIFHIGFTLYGIGSMFYYQIMDIYYTNGLAYYFLQ